MKLTIAAFDFDGTITEKDTFFDFILYSFTFYKLIFIGIISLPILILFTLKIISSDVAKEKIFSFFFRGTKMDEFNLMCEDYSLNRLPKIIKKQALQKIFWHKDQSHVLVIVSASIENWIKPWAETNGFAKTIATVPEEDKGNLTGRFKTKNCNKKEKTRRFLEEYPNRQEYYLFAYGDSHNDAPFLEIADEKFYRKF